MDGIDDAKAGHDSRPCIYVCVVVDGTEHLLSIYLSIYLSPGQCLLVS
jgi:hypothetical protein